MLTEQQFAHRKIGGSMVSTILGLNPYETPEELRLKILGRLPAFEGNEATTAGEIMEEGIRQLYAHRTGRTVRRSHRTIIHPQYDWLTGHVDGLIVGERRGLECKNPHWRSGHLWGPEGTDQIAETYFGQVHAYLLITDYPLWDVAAYFGGSEFRIYTVARDPEIDELIIEATRDFWFKHVLQDVPIAIDPSHPHALAAVQRVYPGTDGSEIPLGPEMDHWHQVRQEALRLAKTYDATADAVKVHLLMAMGPSAAGVLPDGSRYTRKLVTRKAYQAPESTYIDFRHRVKGAIHREV
jgi:putative phage-type endonuclease